MSPDGHRWALAADALGRCEALGGTDLHLRLLKVIALADLLKERSRLPASQALLKLALSESDTGAIENALKDLRRWSLAAFRRFADAWTIFEGSDFDIDQAVEEAVREATGTVGQALERLATFRPMVAKRHYHETGALRWFDVRCGATFVVGRDCSLLRTAPRRHRLLLACNSDGGGVRSDVRATLPRGGKARQGLAFGYWLVAKRLEYSEPSNRTRGAGTCKRRPSGVAGR